MLAAGAAAIAAGFMYFVKRDDGEKRTADHEDTEHEGPVCEQATEPALVQSTKVHQDQMMREREQEAHRLQTSEYCKMIETLTDNEKLLKVSLAEAEEKHQKAVEVITKLEEEKSDLADLVKTLRDTVEDMGNQLCGTHAEYDELIDVSLAETEEKHQKAVEVITKLEEEKSDLTDQVKTLRDTVEDMGNQICETLLHCDELKNECEKEQEAHKLLKSEYHERMETLTNNEKLLKVSLAEAEEKHQKAMETISQLEEEKSDLTDQVKILRNTVEDLGKEQVELNRDCDKLMDDYNRLKDTHNVLQAEHKEVKEQLKCCEELPKESLDQAKESKAVQPTDEHEAGMSGLTNVAMQDTVWYKFKKIFRKHLGAVPQQSEMVIMDSSLTIQGHNHLGL
ncbi:hypothetical protein KOW79_010959 [Hemibagrus wyckioides]|uniref:Uncharacterized protein n=1 Tax=Hemibagrus wyckioides TaxID=337641 RepID=A0A9D3NPC0_9TELE|nr:hypothetical protein KOW79_010959 [Hemibagrus wyckioides]